MLSLPLENSSSAGVRFEVVRKSKSNVGDNKSWSDRVGSSESE
ncbi:hypothetical protein HanIR_Chr08g0350201 [Helianthus annuus]|nr:hypothetical protein HanIR_Chr08g0350201 [Helianthus annuus]